MLGALVQACPESVITKDNRGCTPLHLLLENVMLSHAYTRQQKEVETLKEAIVERDAAVPLQCLLRRWLVRGSPPPPLDPTATERLQKKKAAVVALRPWLEPLVAGCCNGSDVIELARLTAAADLAASTSASAEAEKRGSTVPAVDPARTDSPAGADVPLGPLTGEIHAFPAASVFLRWQDVESALVELADPAKLRDAAKLVPDSCEKQPDHSPVARAKFLMQLSTEVGFDAVQLVRDALATRDALHSLAIAKLKPRLVESCKADENSHLIDLGVEDDLDWEIDAVPAMRLIMNLKQMMRDDLETWQDQDSTSGSDSEDDSEDSADDSKPATLDQLLNIAMLRLHDAEAEVEHMVKLLVDADARDEYNNKVYVTMEQNEAEQIPLRVLLKNTFVAQPVMTRLLGFLSAKDERSAIQPGANFPFRNPLLLLCADRHDITADMVAAVVKASPATAAVTDGYDFDAMQIVIERQSELRLDASRLTDILAVLAEACPSSVIRREVPKMAEAANWKKHAKIIGKRCGRSPVHMVCERPDVTPEMIEALISRNDQVYVLQDDLGRTPLHTLCENPRVSGQLVRTLLKRGVAAAWMADSHGLTPLQSVCKCNPSCSVEVLQLLAFVYPGAAGLPDERGQTAAHLLSLRTDIKGQTLELMLQVVARAAQNELILQDHAERATALHYLCRRADVTPQMLSTILRYNSRVVSKQDRRRRTALHWLCMAPHKGSESDVSEELIQVFVCKEKFELPVLSSLPRIPGIAELDLDPEFTNTDTAESEPLVKEANDEVEVEPEPEHEMEYGVYAIHDALELTDLNGRTALHYLCRREDMKPSQLEPLVRALAKAKPQTVYMRDCLMDRQARSFTQGLYNPDRSPLHELLRRTATYRLNVGGGITEALVSALLMADESVEHRSNCGAVVDFFGRTAFHVVCSREDLGPQLREELITAIVEAAPSSIMILDDFSEGGLHTLCDFYEATEADPDTTVASITPRMVSVVLEANPQVLGLIDLRGMTAFMHLCANPYVTPELIAPWLQVKANNPTEIPRRLSGDHDARLKAIFLATDLDGNGELAPEELAEGIRQNGELVRLLNLENASAENIDAIVHAMDCNQNGLIDMSEFVNFFESEPVVQAVPPQPGKATPTAPRALIQPTIRASQAGSQHAALSFVNSMRRASAVNNDVVIPEEEFLLPEELPAVSLAIGSQEQEEQDRVDYGGWRAAKALLQIDRVGIDGKDAPASCCMQLVVRRAKAQDRWKMKTAGGVQRFLTTALAAAAAINTEQMDDPCMAIADAEHGRTALHWLCMNQSITQRDLVKILAAVGKRARSSISVLTTEPPFATPLHLVVARDDAHADMLRPLVRFRREAAAVRDQMGWLPIQLVYTKPGFKSRSAAAMLDLLAEAYPDGCMEPAPNTLIQNMCSLHVICAGKDVCIESLRAVVNHCPGAAGLRDEHMMVPLHYLCKSTSICSSFRSLPERLERMKQRVNVNTFRLIHVLLEQFSHELCRFVHLNHRTQDLDAAEQCRQRWDDNWRTRELPPELLMQITQDSTGHLADSWRDCVCDILAPLAALLMQVCSQCTPQPNIPGPVFKLHYPHARMRANWSSFVGDVMQYMTELQKLAAEWSGPGGRSLAAKQPTPDTYYGYVHAATRAAAYYAKSTMAEADNKDRSSAAVRPTRQQRAKYSAAAEAVQYPSLSAWSAENHVQFNESGDQAAFGHGRAATMSNASRDGHGSVAQAQDVARKVESIMRKTRQKPRRASHKKQCPSTDFGVSASDFMPVFQLRQEDLREPVRVASPSEETRSEVAVAEAKFATSVSQLRALEEEVDLARAAVVQMIEELSNAHPAAAQVRNRYGRTPLHFLALNHTVPPMLLPAMLRALIKCDRSVLLVHALSTIETVVKGQNAALQNQRHRTPLHCVIERDDLTPAMVEACVVSPGEESAAKEVDYWGNTPLQAMLLRRDLDDDVIVEVAKLLAKASAACLSAVNTAGLTALHMLVESTLSTDAMTRALALLCAAADADAIATQEHSDTDFGFGPPFTDAQRASFNFKPNDRIDVWLDGQWREATVEQYTPQGLSRPWRVEYKLVDGGVRGAFLLEDDYECVRKAHYRVGDLVDIDTDGQWRQAKITSYTPQFEDDPWRAEFTFADTTCNTVGALLLDDDFEKIRIHQSTSSITSVRRAAWALRAAAKVNHFRRQKRAEMRHSRQARRRIHGTTRRTVLHLVCARADVHAGMVQAVLKGRSSSNPCATLQDSDGCTALHRLCAQTSATLETIRAYLNGINASDAAKAVESQDGSGSTPLHRLCTCNADTARLPDMIAEMVNASADAVDTTDNEQCTPLHYLVNRTDVTPQMVDALVSKNPAATTIQDTIGRTALHKLSAAKHLSLPLLGALLPPQGTLGNNRDEISATLACAQDVEGRTALHMVCRRRVDFDVDENGQSTLDLAEAVRMIAAHCDEEALTAQESVRLGDSQDREWDRSALHDACQRRDVTEELVQALMTKCPDIGTCYDIHGCTALHVLLLREDIRVHRLVSLIRAYTSTCVYAPIAHIKADEAELLRQKRRMAGVSEDLNWVAPDGLNGFEAAELRARRTSGWTPLHELALRPDLNVEMIEAMGVHRQLAGTIQNFGGRTPLHTLLARPDLFTLADLENVIDAMVACNEQAVSMRDLFDLGLGRGRVDDRTPLHYICARNDLHDPAVLRSVFSRNPAAALQPDRNGRLPVHLLLRRETPLTQTEGKPAGLLAAMVGVAQESISYKCKYYRGATALHLLAQRADCSTALLQMMLLGGVDDEEYVLSHAALAAAVTKTTAIETPTALRRANPNIPAPFSEKPGSAQGTAGDDAGWTPLHVLCVNPAVSPGAIRMLASAVPSAAKISDAVGRLPIHLLLENAAGVDNSDLADMLRTLAKVQPTSIKTQDRVHRRTGTWLGTARASDGARASQARAAEKETNTLLSKIGWVNRTPLHVAAARPGVSVEVLRVLLEACPAAAMVSDVLGRTALHRLVLNPSVTRPLLECAIAYGQGALMQKNKWGRTPLASLAFNKHVSSDDLADMMSYVARQFPPAMLMKDIQVRPAKVKGGAPLTIEDRTPLLVLCERPDVSTKMLAKVLEIHPEAALMPDGYGATPLLTVSRRKDLSATHNLQLRAVLNEYIARATKGS